MEEIEFLELLQQYNYVVPLQLIAQEPARPRDSARLLIYDRSRDAIAIDRFLHLPKYLPRNAVLVFNDTRVFPARLTLRKETGGRCQVLYLGQEGAYIRVMANKPLKVGMKLSLTPHIYFLVHKKIDRYYLLQALFSFTQVMKIFEHYGMTPIPPYIKHSLLSEARLRKAYQTVFAKQTGSVAAPTASLHFTKRLFTVLRRHGCAIKFVTLHVNLGTFAPLTSTHVAQGKLHQEYYSVDKKTADFLRNAKRAGRPIVAVGTTVARTLESASDHRGNFVTLAGPTDLFIRDGYKFKFITGMITNFHVPKSSLLMLVAALVGREKLFALYARATQEKFRFFSFGDGMLVC